MAIVKGVFLIKGVQEKIGATDGKVYRSVHVYGLEGDPCDLALNCNAEDELYQRCKRSQFSKVQVIMNVRTFNGIPKFDMLDFEALPVEHGVHSSGPAYL